MLVIKDGKLCTVTEVKLFQKCTDIISDCALAKAEFIRYFLVGQPLCDSRQKLCLTFGQTKRGNISAILHQGQLCYDFIAENALSGADCPE